MHTELGAFGFLMFPFYVVASELDLNIELFNVDIDESKRRTGILLHIDHSVLRENNDGCEHQKHINCKSQFTGKILNNSKIKLLE